MKLQVFIFMIKSKKHLDVNLKNTFEIFQEVLSMFSLLDL